MNKKNDNVVDGLRLLQLIANKDKNRKEAEDALNLFIAYFEPKIMTWCDIHAQKVGYGENVAFEAIQCTFNRVRLYPTFDMRKSRSKDEERAIILWLHAIAASQMSQFTKKGVCTQIENEEDLSVIESVEDFINTFNLIDLDASKKMQYVIAMEKKLSVLDDKHKIIYMTYKAYYTRGKKLPRSVMEKLRNRLGLTQVTIRVYKREACIALNEYELLKQ